MEERDHLRKELVVLAIRVVIALALALLGRFLFTEAALRDWGMGNVGALIVHLCIMVVAFLIVAYDVIMETIEGVFKEHEFFNENALMLLASLAAFCLRAFGEDSDESLEAVLVISLFQIGEMVEHIADHRSKHAVLKAIDLSEETATVEKDGVLLQKKAVELSLGDVCVYAVGQKILGDGVIVEGEAELDTSSFTGESLPVPVRVGDAVNSLTVVCSGTIKVETTKEYENSSAAKLRNLLEEASEKKSKTVRFIDRFAAIYTPVMVLLCLIVAAVPPLFIGISDPAVWKQWIYTGLMFLVVSCPCAIVISVPLAYFAGIGLSAKRGVIVKGGSHLDALLDLDLISFDKTGTLTTGSLEVDYLRPVGIEDKTLIEYLATAESVSHHPLAKAIQAKYGQITADLEGYQEIPGRGVRLIFAGKTLLVGNVALLEESLIPINEDLPNLPLVVVAYDGTFCGYAVFKESVRSDSRAVLSALKAEGVKPVLLSGDRPESVRRFANTLNIEEAYGGLLPEDKANILSQKKGQGQMVGFVGDGVNDAPSLVLADCGIAMGDIGSDLAVENADIVLASGRLSSLAECYQIGKKVHRRVLFNIVFSLVVKLGIAVAAFVGSLTNAFALPLWVAGIGDTGTMIIAVVSSLLLLSSRIKPVRE